MRVSLCARTAIGAVLAVAVVGLGALPSSAVPTSGSALAWGSNTYGELGNGTFANSSVPVAVNGPTDVVSVSAGGDHGMALRSDGTVWTWGRNAVGQLGNGTTTNSTIPVRVCAPGQTAPCGAFLSGIKAVSAGSLFSLALRNDGTVWAWGQGIGLGAGFGGALSVPVQVCAVGAVIPCTSFLQNVVSISAGSGHNGGLHAMALRSDGTAVSWGFGFNGELGAGPSVSVTSVPVQVCAPTGCGGLLTGVTAIGTGESHSFAVKSDGTVFAWGDNVFAQLGDGTLDGTDLPVQVCAPGQTAPCTSFLGGVQAVTGRNGASVAVKSDGTVWTWGNGFSGQAGNGTNTAVNPVPVQVCAVGQSAPCSAFLTGAVAVAAGLVHEAALLAAGKVVAWGNNSEGQLGDGTTTGRNVPVVVSGVGGASGIAAGANHTLAVVGAPSADLMVAKSASAYSVTIGDPVTFTITVKNNGPQAVSGAQVVEPVAGPMTFASLSAPTGGSCLAPPAGSAGVVTCTLGLLASGATATFTVTTTAVAKGLATDTATVTGPGTVDPNPANNSASAVVNVNGPEGDKWPTGDKGVQGDKGQQGDKGGTGDKGQQGDKGLPGDQGGKGVDGDKGTQGDKGLPGYQGGKGVPGDKGPQGDKGPRGERGPRGHRAPQHPWWDYSVGIAGSRIGS